MLLHKVKALDAETKRVQNGQEIQRMILTNDIDQIIVAKKLLHDEMRTF